MGYNAPDPEQFSKMEQAFSYMSPLAAAQIALPAHLFSGPVTFIARAIYLKQANPGQIMQGAAHWLKCAEKYLAAAEALRTEAKSLSEDEWSGDDRKAFEEKAEKAAQQLETIAAFAMQVGISLFAIATMLSVMIPLMLAVATAQMAFAVFYLATKAIPPPVGPVVSENCRVIAMTTGATCLTVINTIEAALKVAAQGLAAAIGGNMTISWAYMASRGNLVNPGDTIGSTGFSLLQGLAQMTVGNLMAPGRTGTGTVGKISPKLDGIMAKGNPYLLGFTGVQGTYNTGMNIQGDVNPDAENKMTGAGVDLLGQDWIPNTFEDAARGNESDLNWNNEQPGDDAPGKGPGGVFVNKAVVHDGETATTGTGGGNDEGGYRPPEWDGEAVSR
ncbi:hypothetical protein ACFQS3_00045 [Glycomyces mayteni]|uniref:Uncharacterized protein n=1 Tax=Glycomyces mayteni TaxID=543887 RepID=A0ABW2D4B9_9ACTN